MRRFVYAPDAQAFIQTEQFGLVDVSPDIVSGSVHRILNGVSTASLTLHNPQRKYLRGSNTNFQPIFKPMDRITIYLTRVYQPMQVLSGFLTVVPYKRLYPDTIELTASCTIKALQYTYWDPGLQYVINILKKYGWYWDFSSGIMASQMPVWDNDPQGGLGELLREILHLVGGWPISRETGKRNTVHIMRLPEEFIQHMTTLVTHQAEHLKEDKKFAEELVRYIATGHGVTGVPNGYSNTNPGGGGPVSGGGGYGGGNGSNGTCGGKANPKVNDKKKLADAINKWLAMKVPELGGTGQAMVDKGAAANVNPLWCAAMAPIEGPCERCSRNNFNHWGILTNKCCNVYSSWPEGIQGFYDRVNDSVYSGLDTVEEFVAMWLCGVKDPDTCRKDSSAGSYDTYVSRMNDNINQIISLAADALSCGGTGGGGTPTQNCQDAKKMYVNPLSGIPNLTVSRIDMGVDYCGAGVIKAMGDAVVTKVVPNGSYSGWPPDDHGGVIIYRLLNGPAQGLSIYVAEDINPTVGLGPVSKGQVIATFNTIHTCLEMGWSGDGHDAFAHNYYNEGDLTAHGDNFNDLLTCVGAPSGTRSGRPTTGSIGPEFPKWKDK